jgi:hypothetical protein
MSLLLSLVLVGGSIAYFEGTGPHASYLRGFHSPHAVFVPAMNISSTAAGVRVCPHPAKYVGAACSSQERRRAFFFEDKEYEAIGDVADLPVDTYLGGRHALPSVSEWAIIPYELNRAAGYLLIYYP